MDRYNVSFAGAGRVGSALCTELFRAGYPIGRIVTRSASGGKLLAGTCKAAWTSELDFRGSTDIIIVAVPDHSLAGVLSQIRCDTDTLVLHTAGSFGFEVFPDTMIRKGILYPLQTFTTGRKVNFPDIPFLIESSSHETDRIIQDIVRSLGARAYIATTEKRRMLHLSAVFVCNFTNFMLTAGKDITSRAGESFELLVPLINETITKALEIGPEKSQTGPALRKDMNTIEKHLDLLSFSPDLQGIYRNLSEAIIKYFSKS